MGEAKRGAWLWKGPSATDSVRRFGAFLHVPYYGPVDHLSSRLDNDSLAPLPDAELTLFFWFTATCLLLESSGDVLVAIARPAVIRRGLTVITPRHHVKPALPKTSLPQSQPRHLTWRLRILFYSFCCIISCRHASARICS